MKKSAEKKPAEKKASGGAVVDKERAEKQRYVDKNLTKGDDPNQAERRITPAAEVAAAMGYEILDAQTELEEFEIDKFTPQARLIIVLGKRNTGKTVWITDFLYHNRHLWAYGCVFTKTKHYHYWSQYFPHYCVRNGFDEHTIRRWMKIQEQRVTQKGINSRVLFLFDDMAADVAMKYNNLINELAYNGRHLQIDVIYATQDVVKANTALRRNADLFVLLTTVNLVTLKHVYEEFASVEWRSFVDFVANELKQTEDYGTMVIDNNDPNARGRDRFFKYTANPELPQFTMLCAAAWQAGDGRSKGDQAQKQRAELDKPTAYAKSTLEAYKRRDDTRISHAQYLGQTEEAHRNRDINMFETLLRGAK
jgi:hypothetical protein